MSGSVNKAIIIGNLGGDPEIRFTPSGSQVANFNVATSDNWVDKEGNKQEKTEWHRIVAWGKLADFVGTYLAKGRKVYVEGAIQTREWEDKEGQRRYTTEIKAFVVQGLDSKPQNGMNGSADGEERGVSREDQQGAAPRRGIAQQPVGVNATGDGDDLPF